MTTTPEAPTVVIPVTEHEFEELLNPFDSTHDPNAKAHIIRPYENGHIWQQGMTAKDVVYLARLNGVEITALCGHKWVPKYNPEGQDSCEPCFRIAGELINNPNSRD